MEMIKQKMDKTKLNWYYKNPLIKAIFYDGNNIDYILNEFKEYNNLFTLNGKLYIEIHYKGDNYEVPIGSYIFYDLDDDYDNPSLQWDSKENFECYYTPRKK